MSTDLIAFLGARLGEAEAAAKAATPGPWYAFNSGHGDDWYVASRAYGLVSTGLHSGPDPDGDEILMIERDRRDADYIARHDPARVLREVEAKRAIIARHKTDIDPADAMYGSNARCEECGTYVVLTGPCPTLRILVAVYGDHPEYDPSWAPEKED